MKLTLIQGAQVFAPKDMGTIDVLFCGNHVLNMGQNLALSIDSRIVEVVDGRGKYLIPGLVDSLVHITGGGGEGGFHTRTPEVQLTDASLAGVTTLVGALGTDDVSRTLPELVAKAKSLESEGLSVYCYTGSYQVPIITVTDSIRKDIMFIDNMIGVGEVAIADHRGSHPTAHELTRIASDARVAGMLSGKKGVVYLHVGDAKECLSVVHDVIENSAIPASQFYATHINRQQTLLDASIAFAKAGGFVDMTTSTTEQILAQGEIKASHAVTYLINAGVPLEQITMSSDGNASLPAFDDKGQLIGLQVGKIQSLFDAFTELVQHSSLTFSQALQVVTANPAQALGLNRKGRIGTEYDTDLVLLDAKTLAVESVWSKGRRLVANQQAIVKGTFEA